MSSTRLQFLKDTGKYSEDVLSKFSKIISENGGKIPDIFFIDDIGIATLKNVIRELTNVKRIDVIAPEGALSSKRRVIIIR